MVTGYLKVEYLADGARDFNCTKHIIRGSTENVPKMGVVAETVMLKTWEGVYLHH